LTHTSSGNYYCHQQNDKKKIFHNSSFHFNDDIFGGISCTAITYPALTADHAIAVLLADTEGNNILQTKYTKR